MSHIGGRTLEIFAAAFEAAPVGMCLIDVSGRMIRANAALCDLLGKSAEETLFTPVSDLVHEDDRDTIDALHLLLLEADGAPEPFEQRFRRHDGSSVWLRMSVFPVLAHGVDRCFAAVVEDLTEANVAERRFEALVERSSERYTVLATDWTVLYLSPMARATLGVAPGDKLPLERLHPDDVATARSTFQQTIAEPGSSHRMVGRVRMTDGATRTLEVRMTNMLDDPAVGGIVFNSRDVTDMYALRARFETMVEHSTDTYSVLAPDMTLLYASPASLLYQVPIGAPAPLEFVHEGDRDRVVEAFARVCAVDGSSERVRFRTSIAAPSIMHVEARFTNLIEHPSVRGVMLNTRDVSKEVTTTQALNYQAFHDGLTGLANRASLVHQLGDRIQRASTASSTVAVEVIDLDRFKLINDAHGYAVGNEVLQLIAKRLTSVVDPNHVVARLGADEFVVMGEGYDAAAATGLARRLASAISNPITLSTGDSVVVTASVGIAVGATCDPEALLWEADTALYLAKDRGRDTWEFFDDQLRDRALVRHQTEQRVRRALAEDGFGLGYQPIVSLRDGQVVEAEALLRMRLGAPEPSVSDVVVVAEETGLIHDIGARALRHATRQAAAWKERLGERAPRSVSVNVSGRQLYGLDFAALVASALVDAALPPECLCLELTESTLLEADRRVTQQLFALKDVGVDLAIDDFGTGYSSLTYLKRFPIDVIKIDRSFVAGVGSDASDSEIVRAVIGLGQALGLRTVAEGVERESQAIALRALGCDRAQGFFYGAALDSDRFVDFLTARNA